MGVGSRNDNHPVEVWQLLVILKVKIDQFQ